MFRIPAAFPLMHGNEVFRIPVDTAGKYCRKAITRIFAMNHMTRITTLISTLAALLLGACASTPPGLDKKEAELKAFSAKTETAGVYIIRSETAASLMNMQVEVDGKPVAKIAAQSFIYTELAPGKHAITSKAENADTLEINVEAGKLYYVMQDTKPGNFYVRVKQRLAEETEGQEGVKLSKLAYLK
jgi:hypothetical protein